MRITSTVALTLLLATPNVLLAMDGEPEQFGEPLSPNLEVVPIETIVADLERWEGERVRIEGEVRGVCALKGCWMDLVSPQNATLRVKVDDGIIVFPESVVGGHAMAEGTVEIVRMSRERYAAWMRHVADEEERAFDPASIGDGPYRIVRLRGTGAEVSGAP